MSPLAAAALADAEADEYRRRADEVPVDDDRVQAVEDRPAIRRAIYRRMAQAMNTFANKLRQLDREDITVSERGPRR